MAVFSRFGNDPQHVVFVGPQGERLLIPNDHPLAQETGIETTYQQIAPDPNPADPAQQGGATADAPYDGTLANEIDRRDGSDSLMPSVSGRQHRFMEMVAHDPKAAKRVGVSQSVGEDFAKADEGKTFKGARGRYAGKKVKR